MDQWIEKALVKYLMQESDINELDLLSEWIKDPQNRMDFEHYVEVHYKVNLTMSRPNLDEIKKRLLTQIQNDNRKTRTIKRRNSFLKYAALLVVFIVAASFLFKTYVFDGSEKPVNPIIVKQNINPGMDKATLTLSDGAVVALSKGQDYKGVNVVSNGEELVYQEKQTNAAIGYNILTIPRGGKFFIKLSDGTKIWLNSESQLKYPTTFLNDSAREVELVYGEAYFEVSHSTEHNGAKFVVLNESQKIEVLGTAFNLKAYRDESHIYTTLVRGKVAIDYDGEIIYLNANEQSHVDLNHKNITLEQVNVKDIISWKEGVFAFTKKPLKEIMKVLSRWYDVKVVFEDKSLETLTFTGVLSKNQNLEEILKTINNLSVIKNYEIYDGKIIIK